MENKVYVITCDNWCEEAMVFHSEKEAREQVEQFLAEDFKIGETDNVYTIHETVKCVSAKLPSCVEVHWF